MQNTLATARKRTSVVVLMAFTALALMTLPASATATTPESAANTAISDGVGSALSIVTTNIPLILGVAVAFVALKYGKRLLGKL